MNRLYLVVCFVNIFVFSVYSAPAAPSTSNIFDLIQSYSVQNCPALNKNVLIDKNMTDLSRCRDVSLEKVPARMAFDSMNAYLCVAILDADFRLCNVLSNESYADLPKSYNDLRESIASARDSPAEKACNALKNLTVTPFNNSADIGVKLAPWMSKFNEQLFGTGCMMLCSDFGDKTNVFCSLLWYINAHVQRVIEQHRSNTAPSIKVKTTTVANLKAGTVSVPVKQPQVNLAPALQAPEAAKVQPHVEPEIKTTKLKPATTTVEPTSTKQPPHNQVSGDKANKSQAQTTAVVGVEQDGEKMAANVPAVVAAPVQVVVGKEPVVNQVKPKESDKIVTENIDVKSPSAVVENSAPQATNTADENKLETSNTAAEIKFETPITPDKFETTETKEEATNKDMEITDKVVNGIFDTTVAAPAPKELKPENYFDDDADDTFKLEDAPGLDKEQENAAGPVISDQSITPREYADVEDSNFFAYFMFVSVMFIAGYVLYHNKQKILALVLEGRRDRNARRRPNTASYRKLNSNLEEAVTSKCSGSAAHVIY